MTTELTSLTVERVEKYLDITAAPVRRPRRWSSPVQRKQAGWR